MKRPLFALALGLLSLVVLAQDSGSPTNFGIQDDNFPQDPREYGRGHFADFPTWPVSPELPDDAFVFARLR